MGKLKSIRKLIGWGMIGFAVITFLLGLAAIMGNPFGIIITIFLWFMTLVLAILGYIIKGKD